MFSYHIYSKVSVLATGDHKGSTLADSRLSRIVWLKIIYWRKLPDHIALALESFGAVLSYRIRAYFQAALVVNTTKEKFVKLEYRTLYQH